MSTWPERAQGDLGEDDHRAQVTGSALHFRYYLTHKPALRVLNVPLLPNQWPDTQEHLEAGLVFHNPTTLQGEAKH